MSGHQIPSRQKLSDDDIRDILLSTEEPAALAARFGVQPGTVARIRRRNSFRVIKIARELGLLPPSPRRIVYDKQRRTVAVPESVVRSKAIGVRWTA